MHNRGRSRTGLFVFTLCLLSCSTIFAQNNSVADLVVTRDGNVTEFRLDTADPFHTTTHVVTDENLMRIPDTTKLIVRWNETDSDNNVTPYYAISMDGVEMATVRKTSYDLNLRFNQFDPAISNPIIPASLMADSESQLYIVQFITQPLKEFREVVHAAGGTILSYLPNHSYVVKMNATMATQVGASAYVRSVTTFHPAYKLEELLIPEIVSGISAEAQRKYSIAVFEKGEQPQKNISDRIQSLGRTVHYTSPKGMRMDATLTLSQLAQIVIMDEVSFIDIPGEIGVDMDIAREFGGADYLETVGGFTGQGVTGEVSEGILSNHLDFQNPYPPILHGSSAPISAHGTWVYGVVFGDGSSDSCGPGESCARGLLPDGQGIYTISPVFDRYIKTSQLVKPDDCDPLDLNCPYNAVFQTNSWGTDLSTDYTCISQEMDQIIFDLDILICQSQGNTGSQYSRLEAWAKNIVSVGGIKHFGTLDNSEHLWCDGPNSCGIVSSTFCPSTGPASDGRIKPDLSHFFDCIKTTNNNCDTCYKPNFGGTSSATPITCGYFGLLFQMWHEEVFPGFGGGTSVFDSRPHSSTARAMMINTAFKYPLNKADFSRYNHGWGMADVGALYDARDNIMIINETDVITNLQVKSYQFEVQAGDPALRVTLVYADPPGDPFSGQHRKNDLSLIVRSPISFPPGAPVDHYWGNSGLITINWSLPDSDPSTPQRITSTRWKTSSSKTPSRGCGTSKSLRTISLRMVMLKHRRWTPIMRWW